MGWNQLLSEKRVLELLDGKPSRRSDDDLRTQFERDFGLTGHCLCYATVR